MSTVQRVNFEPCSPVMEVHRRDFRLADPALGRALHPTCLVDGEWVTLTADYKISRASAIDSAGAAATVRSFPYWAERGRTDVIARAEPAGPVLFLGVYECDTRIFDASVTIGSGAPITQVMQPLKVATITLGARNYCGLVGHGGANDPHPVVGYVTRLPLNNDKKLRFIQGWRS